MNKSVLHIFERIDHMITVVIMAGGRGERFWPRSRKKLPKQLLSLTGDGKTMIQLTVDRVKSLVEYDNIYIVTNEDFADIISYQLPQLPTENILIEPVGKNTAPCIGLAAVHIAKKEKDAVMLILPSDHLIQNEEKFINTLKSGVEMAKKDENILTLGIVPNYPETGYGYINFGNKIDEIGENSIYKVTKFVEKPSIEKAQEYMNSGNYLWNSGMFIWKASTILDNIEKYMPDLHKGLKEIENSIGTYKEAEVLKNEFNKFESISIDYGIMEHADKIFTIPGSFGWDDVGSWTALERISDMDTEGNVVQGNIISVDTKGCIFQGSEKLIAAVGVENLVVVDTDDATLICAKDKCQDIKKLLSEIKNSKLEDYL